MIGPEHPEYAYFWAGAGHGFDYNDIIERYSAAYRLDNFAFIEMVNEGTQPLAGIRDGLEAQRLAEAALVSFKSGVGFWLDALSGRAVSRFAYRLTN